VFEEQAIEAHCPLEQVWLPAQVSFNWGAVEFEQLEPDVPGFEQLNVL